MTDPAAPVTLTNAMAHAGRDALRQAADLFGATLPEDWRETQAMAVVVYEAMTRAAAPEPPADDLAALIAECKAKDWEWRLEGSWVQDGPFHWHWEISASLRKTEWQLDPPDRADEDGWIGLSDDATDASLVDLFRAAMDAARQAAGKEDLLPTVGNKSETERNCSEDRGQAARETP